MFDFFGMNTALVFQVVALLVALVIEIRFDNKRWRRWAIIGAILVSLAAGFVGWSYETKRLENEAIERIETSRALGEIESGVADVGVPLSEINSASRTSLEELRILRQRNSEQQVLISSLSTSVQRANEQAAAAYDQYRDAQNQVISLSNEVVVLQERISVDAADAAAAREVAARERREQTAAANRAAAQAACAAGYKPRPDGSGSSTTFPNLRPYGGGSCLNGVYYPPR